MCLALTIVVFHQARADKLVAVWAQSSRYWHTAASRREPPARGIVMTSHCSFTLNPLFCICSGKCERKSEANECRLKLADIYVVMWLFLCLLGSLTTLPFCYFFQSFSSPQASSSKFFQALGYRPQAVQQGS